jgi:collagen triple helix repeat protein
MADQKISELTLGTPTDTDIIPFVDLISGITKKTTKTDLKGDQGDAATVDAGTTTTLSPGASATVVNSGSTSEAVFDFGIPEGDKGDTGDQGIQGIQGIQGDQGIQGETGDTGLTGDTGPQGDPGEVTTTPVSVTDNAVTRFDGTTGALIQDSGIIIDDTDNASGFNAIQFELTPTGSCAEGQLMWSADNGTVEIGLPGGNVCLQVGEEVLMKAKNVSGIGTTNGKAFYISGATGGLPDADFANASDTTGSKMIAVCTEDIANNSSGYFTTFGLVRDIDTSFGSDGDVVYLDDTAGGLTTDKLDYPDLRIKIGYILNSHATEGVLLVTIQGDQWLKRFQAMKEPTGFTLNYTDLMGDLTFVNGTRTLSLAPKGGQDFFSFFTKGQEYRKAAQEDLIITDVEGLHVVYYSDAGVLTESVNPNGGVMSELVRTSCLVSIIYWDTSAGEAIYFGEERHGIQMDGSTHSLFHYTQGLAYLSGLGLTDMSVDGTGITVDAQFGVSAGGVSDEDIYNAIDAVTSTTGLPIYYMLGAGAEWQKHTEAGFSVRTYDGTSATRLAWNEYTGGAWQLTEITNNDFVLCHVFATTDINNPMIAIMGQADYLNKTSARAGASTEIHNLILDDVLFPEIRPIATVILKTNTTYANTVNAYIVSTDDGDDYIDWRDQAVSRVSLTTSDHESLSGLLGGAANDHYHLTTAEHTVVGNTSGTNTGDQTSIVGITGTVAQFNTAITDATLSGNNTGDEISATSSAEGVVELAIAAEINTGTDTERAIPIDQFVASDRNIRFVDFIVVDMATDVEVATDLIEWRVPFDCTIIQSDTDKNYFMAWNATAGTTGTMVVDIHKNGTTIMTTNKLDIETTEKTTEDATTQPDVTTTALSAGDIITIDVDAIHTTAAKGLGVRIALRMT